MQKRHTRHEKAAGFTPDRTIAAASLAAVTMS
jgi:hypothetical protein